MDRMDANPYVYFMAQINNAELREAQFGEQMARLIIKISSVFTHPMIFGLFLGLAMVYLYSLKDKRKQSETWHLSEYGCHKEKYKQQ